MNKTLSLILTVLFTAGLPFARANPTPAIDPSPLQLSQIERGYGMFIHYGINTFNETEWSDGKLPASSYNPSNLDCDQWIKFAKDAGFRYIILVTKHHDGFCLWDSKYTDYDVASSPVKIDVVGEVANACTKYGVQFGIYYSIWDRHEPTHNDPDPDKYVQYMKNQLTELLTNYGPVCEIWFDGGWAKKEEDWKLPDVYSEIKKLQPDCLVTCNHTIGCPDNIHGIRQPKDYRKGDPIRFFPVDFRIKDPNIARWDDPKLYTHNGRTYYLPFQHTLCLSSYWNWFQKKDNRPVRPVDELEQLFYWCTANDNIMILNVPPGRTGQIREHERLRVLQLADKLGIRGGKKPLPSGPKNLTFDAKATATNTGNSKYDASKVIDPSLETRWAAKDKTATLEITFDSVKTFDTIAVFEYAGMKSLGDGFSYERNFRIEHFNIEVSDTREWKAIHVGKTVGDCLKISLPERVRASALRINILDATAPPSICHVSVAGSWTQGIRGPKN